MFAYQGVDTADRGLSMNDQNRAAISFSSRDKEYSVFSPRTHTHLKYTSKYLSRANDFSFNSKESFPPSQVLKRAEAEEHEQLCGQELLSRQTHTQLGKTDITLY